MEYTAQQYMNLQRRDLAQQNNPEKSPGLKPIFFQPRLTVSQHNDVYEQQANHMAYKLTSDKTVNSNSFFKPVISSLQGSQKNVIQRHRALDATESVDCLHKAEDVIKNLEQNTKSGGYGNQPYIQGAVKILRDKMTAGKIKCYAFDGMVHGEDDYSGDEIRLDGINQNWISDAVLLHEGVHAFQASQNPQTAQKYASALQSQRPINGNNPADLKLLKWKAWTEYWAYRAKLDYYNPTMKQPRSEADIDQLVRLDPGVSVPTKLVQTFDSTFDPKTYTP